MLRHTAFLIFITVVSGVSWGNPLNVGSSDGGGYSYNGEPSCNDCSCMTCGPGQECYMEPGSIIAKPICRLNCGPNEALSMCEDTCVTKGKPTQRICSSENICGCKEGYVRDKQTRQCIPSDQCSLTTTRKPTASTTTRLAGSTATRTTGTGTTGRPGTTGTPTTPRTSGTPGTPTTARTPGTTRTPTTAHTPGTTRTPTTARTPGTTGTPTTARTPGTTRTPTTARTPGTTGTPTTAGPLRNPTNSGTPTTPRTPVTPGTPTTARTPGTTGTPTTTGPLRTPATPRTPVTPGIPTTARTPGAPTTPGTSTTPRTPKTLGTPTTERPSGISRTPTTAIPTCCENEVLKQCSGCEATCAFPVGRLNCVPNCQQAKCECRPGYVRCPISGRCVCVSLCPKNSCPPNEDWNTCPTCEATCTNLKPICPMVCKTPACQCCKGYVRCPISGRCVTLASCPKVNPLTQQKAEEAAQIMPRTVQVQKTVAQKQPAALQKLIPKVVAFQRRTPVG